MTLQGLAPLCAPDARLLVLGSMPGTHSLAQQQYYAHPRNLFWELMYQAQRAPGARQASYTERCQCLLVQQVALWDVLHSCRRSGSLDSQIERDSEQANALAPFLDQHPHIERIVFNGNTAWQLFRRHLLSVYPEWATRYQLIVLPSTSPANASQSRLSKQQRWEQAVWLRAR